MPSPSVLSVRQVAAACAVAGLLLAGCGAARGAESVAPPTATGPSSGPVVAPLQTQSSAPGPTQTPSGATPDGSRAPSPVRPTGTYSPGWRITMYYTAVESYHSGRTKAVRGCLKAGCARSARTALGTFPETFVKAVQTEGAGRITSGPYRGRYLSWTNAAGHFWLEGRPQDAAGKPLKGFVSAAADRDVLARGKRFTVASCGRSDGSRPVPARVCDKLRAAEWTVVDVFRPTYGGAHHADLYLGEETGPGFTRSPWYTTLNGAALNLQ